ncbi:chemotaxis protein CheB [Desulfobacter curvatus]|uniref:chemotaxis protein CheB n=1 Tax=Desulfobacter curvatus TaxID=2290 RepID=UPI00037252B6|nr:chemotaxis protein CheB [Desulfobacter curvatus]
MFEAVVIGGSAGSIEVLISLLGNLPPDYPLPIVVAIHLHPSDQGDLARQMDSRTSIRVKEAREKHPIKPSSVYIAPADYHLLVEHDKTFALTVDDRVNYARPSIDVLFESAAFVYGEHLAGILLSGANNDGALGLAAIKRSGGLTVVQAPDTAQCPAMPQAAINIGCVDRFLEPATLLDILR